MAQSNNLRKKPMYPVLDELYQYLELNNRVTKTDIAYEELLRFRDFIPILDKHGNDTLWLNVFYSESDFVEIEARLNKVYTLLHSDGDEATLPFLKVDSIEYCTFGNSQPFRIRVRNILNDNYTNFYIKKVDASRIYGLELEDIISPNRINYLVYQNTLIEEHILGIPGDVFIAQHLDKCSDLEKSQLAKEFVKFNERCFIGLLGDMRSYNYVVIPIHDFDQVVYRIRAIDFDQQSYEGSVSFYEPQYFKENKKMVDVVDEKLKSNSIIQYRKEVRSSIVKRISSDVDRFQHLMTVMVKDHIAPEEHVAALSKGLHQLTFIPEFKVCKTMGAIVHAGIKFVLKNYKNTY